MTLAADPRRACGGKGANANSHTFRQHYQTQQHGGPGDRMMLGLLVASKIVHKVYLISSGFLTLDHMGTPFKNEKFKNRLCHVLGWLILGLEPKFHDPGTFGGFGKREQRIFNTGPYGEWGYYVVYVLANCIYFFYYCAFISAI